MDDAYVLGPADFAPVLAAEPIHGHAVSHYTLPTLPNVREQVAVEPVPTADTVAP